MYFKKAWICLTFLLFTVIISNIYAQQPLEVWISPEYNENTAGWDTTRFTIIQSGINAVAEAGTVHVNTGFYHESIIINKQLQLIGEGADVTEINIDSSNTTLLLDQVSDCSISGLSITGSSFAGVYLDSCSNIYIQNNSINTNDRHGIYAKDCKNVNIQNNLSFDGEFGGIVIDNCENTIIYNNTIYDNMHGLILEDSHNNLIENNSIYDIDLTMGLTLTNSHNNLIDNNNININSWALLLGNSWGNRIQNNEFYVEMGGNIGLNSSSNNNQFINNKLSGAPCYLIRSDFCSNNLFANNDFSGDGAGACMDIKYASNCIISNNEMSGFHTVAIRFYHADSTIVIGNKIYNPIIEPDDMLQGGFFIYGESCNNLIVGNEISDVPKGISVLQHSDSNQIINNLVQRSSSSIIISNSNNNTIYKNNFDEYILQSFDNGNNNWSFDGTGNYWSDYNQSGLYCNNGAGYKIPPNGMDYHPKETSFIIEPVVTPELAITPFREFSKIEFYIEEDIVWDNQDIELTYLKILDGGSLTIENSTITFSNRYSGFGGIYVCPEATLKISNSEVFFNGVKTWVDEGAILEIKNSKLYNVGIGQAGSGFYIQTDNVIFTDNMIEDGSDITFKSNSEIVNNYFNNVYVGLTIEDGENSIIRNNRIQNVVLWGILLGGNNNNIYNNTITDCWGNAVFIHAGAQSNNIFRNNFNSYNLPVRIGWNLNNFYINEEGNYYSDYLDRFPAARESEFFNDQWMLPYRFSWGDNIDEHPSMVCFFSDTVIIVPDQPVLISPDNNASINMIDPQFIWLNSDNAELYRIQISEDSTFSTPIVNKGNIYDTTYCCLLDTNKTYYWRIISVNDGGHSHWSETWHFDTNSETGIQAQDDIQIPKKFTLYQNYPNPFNPSTTITFDLPRMSEVTLKVYDLLGHEVDKIISKKYSAGTHKLEWNAQNYSSGIYLYKLTADNFIEIKKLILLK